MLDEVKQDPTPKSKSGIFRVRGSEPKDAIPDLTFQKNTFNSVKRVLYKLFLQYAMSPYVKIELYKPKKSGKTAPIHVPIGEINNNVEWSSNDNNRIEFKLNENELCNDNFKILVTAWDDTWAVKDIFIGGRSLDLKHLIDTPNESMLTTTTLYNKRGFRGEIWLDCIYYDKESKLVITVLKGTDLDNIVDYTPIISSKKVVLSMTIVVCWFIISCIVTSILKPEWGFITVFYLSLVTLTTVGYGDIVPVSNREKIFVVFNALLNNLLIISVFANFMGHFGERRSALRSHNKGYTHLKRRFRGKIKLNENDENNPKRYSLIIFRYILLFVIWLSIWIIYWINHNKTFIDALYFSVITATTVGYGDEKPETKREQLFTAITMIFGIGSLVYASRGIQSLFYDNDTHIDIENVAPLHLSTLQQFEDFDKDKTGKVSKFEYLSCMLLSLKMIDETELDSIMNVFDKMDKKQDGKLTLDEIAEYFHVNARSRISARRNSTESIV